MFKERTSIIAPRSVITQPRSVVLMRPNSFLLPPKKIILPAKEVLLPPNEVLPTRAQFAERKQIIMPRSMIETTSNKRAVTKAKTKKVAKVAKDKPIRRRKLALILPAHNEELIIRATISSAIQAGMRKQDIYVADDNSDDDTRKIVIEMLGKNHIITVERSGKAQAIYKAIKHFDIEKRYLWVHVSDADSIFGEDYFRIYRKSLTNSDEYAVAIGFIQSMRGGWIASYRAFCYTFAQHLTRRWQSWFGMISVFPGPLTAFRCDIIKELEFNSKVLAEDLDLTYQIHRKKLGKVHFITRAINYTQDPQNFKDFTKQTMRWQRGFFQCALKYRVGIKPHALDIGIAYQMVQVFLYLFEIFVLVPIIIYTTGRWIIIPTVFLGDFMSVIVLALFSTAIIKRASIIATLPYFYILRWWELILFISAFFEVIVFRRFPVQTRGWDTEGRRYAISASALKDTAKIQAEAA